MTSAGEVVGPSRWVRWSPLAISAQLGAVREGAQRGGEMCCSLQARQLNPPATLEGEAGGWGWGSVTWCALARLDHLTPREGEGWCWAGCSSFSIQPWPPGGLGKKQGWRAEKVAAHHKCWLADECWLADIPLFCVISIDMRNILIFHPDERKAQKSV